MPLDTGAERRKKLKVNFPVFTDGDLDFSEGKENEMIEMPGYILGKNIEEIRAIIASIWCKRFLSIWEIRTCFKYQNNPLCEVI